MRAVTDFRGPTVEFLFESGALDVHGFRYRLPRFYATGVQAVDF